MWRGGTGFLMAEILRGAGVRDRKVWLLDSFEGMPPVEATLRQLFGYTRLHLIGEARKTLKSGQEDWLATTKYFALRVDARGQKDGAYVLNLKLLQENKVLLETDAQLSKASPLVIRGPQIGDGQLVIVLMVQ